MKRWLLVLIPAAVLATAIVWRLKIKQVEAKEQNQVRVMRTKAAPVVSVAEAQVKDVTHRLEAVGSIEAPFNTKISAEAPGQIVYLQAREGDRVTRGEVLVRIDPAQLNSEIRQREAAIAEARSRLAQAQISETSNDATVNQQIAHQAAEVKSAEADFKQASTNYDFLLAASKANIENIQGMVDSANAAIANAKSAIKTAQADLDNATVKLNRVTGLYKEGFIAAQDVDDAKTVVSVKQGALEEAQGKLTQAVGQRDSYAQQKKQAENQGVIGKQKQLAEIDSSRQKVHQAEAALTLAKANTVQKPAYQANIAALRSAVTAAEAALRGSVSRLKDTIVRSPLDGYITARNMDPGAVATIGQPILTVQSIYDVWFTAPIPEEASRKVFVGKEAEVALDAIPGRKLTGRIVQLNPSADPSSRQFTARVLLKNPRNELKPGMFGRLTLETERIPAAVVVRREAVQEGKEGPSVFSVDAKGTAHRKPVALGPSEGDVVVISSGIQPGEKVITISATPLKDGMPVRVAQDTQH